MRSWSPGPSASGNCTASWAHDARHKSIPSCNASTSRTRPGFFITLLDYACDGVWGAGVVSTSTGAALTDTAGGGITAGAAFTGTVAATSFAGLALALRFGAGFDARLGCGLATTFSLTAFYGRLTTFLLTTFFAFAGFDSLPIGFAFATFFATFAPSAKCPRPAHLDY